MSSVFPNVGQPAALPKPRYVYRSARSTDFALERPVLESVTIEKVARAHVYPRHQHLDYQLILAQRGSYRCRLNGATIKLAPRDVLIVKRGDWHEDICARGLRYLAVNFDLAGNDNGRAEDILFNPDVTAEEQIIRGPNREIWRIVGRMRQEVRRADHLLSHFENALLLELFWSLVRALPTPRLSPIFLQRSAAQAFNDRVRRLFDAHLTENLSVRALAAKLGISVRTLTKHCQKNVGRPPARAFTHHKIEYAARVLRHSDVPIKELSHRLGFQDQYHFSKVFRRYLGVPPSRYRVVPK